MPLFNRTENLLKVVRQKDFALEKELQTLVENNLEEIFSCRFVASEFSTGVVHSGRIDTIALSEDNNPVIIEYKIVESSQLLNQSLFYLHWLKDHKGDFQIAVHKALGSDVEVDWSSIRVICIAPAYKKYDLHAAEMMNAPIELWKYKNYDNGMLSLEEVLSSRDTKKQTSTKEVTTREDSSEELVEYTYEQHCNNLASDYLKELCNEIKEYCMQKDEMVDEVPTKHYVAYKLSKSFISLKCQKKKIILTLRFGKKDIESYLEHGRDMSNIGHHGGLPFEVQLVDRSNLEIVKEMINVAFNNIGG